MKTLEKRKGTRLYRLLEFIKSSPDGRRANEIKKWLFEEINPGKVFDPIENRGTYSTALYDRYDGIFKRFCSKINGKWTMPHPMPDDLRVPLYHKPDAEFNWGKSHYHVTDLGGNIWTVTPEMKAENEEFKRTHYMYWPHNAKPAKHN